MLLVWTKIDSGLFLQGKKNSGYLWVSNLKISKGRKKRFYPQIRNLPEQVSAELFCMNGVMDSKGVLEPGKEKK
jgi:hypothetical protein